MKQRLRPAASLLGWLALLVVIALVPGVLDALAIDVPAWGITLYWSALLALAGLAMLDALLAVRLPVPRLQRHVPVSLALGRWSEVHLTLEHDGARDLHLRVFDHPPPALAFEQLPQQLVLKAGAQARLSYPLRALQRGRQVFERCEVTMLSPLRLWETRHCLALDDSVRVYPDFTRLHDEHLMGVDNPRSRIGVRQRQRRGSGLEFHQLREFREGDSLRQIDWKATARLRTPIAREYQDERDQQLIVLLDCGRHMRSQDDELAHFDHALNACLLLAQVALRQGDAVGLSTFAGEQHHYLPPHKGNRQLNLLLDTVLDLHSTQQPADYSVAAQQVMARQKRRALVVLVTSLRDEDDEQLLSAAHQLSLRHRVLVASLSENVIDRLRHTPVERHEQALDYCGAVEFLNARNHVHERLAALGVQVIDVQPQALGARLISRYLGMKKAGAL